MALSQSTANSPATLQAPTSGSWKHVLRNAVRDPMELARRLELPSNFFAATFKSFVDFPLLVTEPFLSRMEKGNPTDPLLLQVLPTTLEQIDQPGFMKDPVGDLQARVAPGVLHKYHGRALLITTGACAAHCRYCFRRHYPYTDEPKSTLAWQPAVDYVRHDSTISEIILSGGDPLTVTDEKLEWLVAQLEAIPHLRRLRLHTRLPIFIPERINDALLKLLRESRLTTWMVLHINHPHEIDQEVLDATQRLHRSGISLLNQSVLLRGINDRVSTLVELSERLLVARVLPYYLHQLDPVAGAAHFHVDQSEGMRLLSGMKERLPGYAVPRYVVEHAERSSKSWLFADEFTE